MLTVHKSSFEGRGTAPLSLELAAMEPATPTEMRGFPNAATGAVELCAESFVTA